MGAGSADAQYLNTTVEELKKKWRRWQVRESYGWRLIWSTPRQAALMGHRAQYAAEVAAALEFIKPTFNEEMRGGHTNM